MWCKRAVALDRTTLLQRAAAIRLAVFDVDGVMTDGRLFRDDGGQEVKAFYSRDGLGLKALKRNGIEVAALTARTSPLVEVRMAELGIELLLQGREDKAAAVEELMDRAGSGKSQTSYAGDDLVDWPAMRLCGFKCAPADACAWIRQRADFVTASPGGQGAAREVCERILEARGLLAAWQDGFQ